MAPSGIDMSGKGSGNAAEGILNSCRRLVQYVHTSSKATEKSLGISSAQHFVLQKLADGEARSITQLAQLTHTHQSSVSVVVKKLCAQKMAKSGASEEDGRKQEIRITAKGQKLLAKWSGLQVQDSLLGAAGRLSLDERRVLDQLLLRLLEELKDGEGQEDEAPPAMFLEE